MTVITSGILKNFLAQDQRKMEGVLPELIKKLINCSCKSISYFRMPGSSDIWAPGFDGNVENQVGTSYVNQGRSIWEFGTNSKTLEKINNDYEKRCKELPKEIKATTTFYLVTPRIWAFNNNGWSIEKWEDAHKKDGWRDVRIYDASILCDWINSEPAVCAWLFEQFGESHWYNFSSIEEAWKIFSNKTNPALKSSMFMADREDYSVRMLDDLNTNGCKIKSSSFYDAYGFCLCTLRQNPETANKVAVVNDEITYNEINRLLRGKIILLSFPLEGDKSEKNKSILCFSKENPTSRDMIELPPIWKSQFINALQDMGLTNSLANETYMFTHGNLLALFRRLPGNVTQSRPKWADAQKTDLLYPIVFLRHYSTANELEKHIISEIAGEEYSLIERTYEDFLRKEDSPIKKISDIYTIVNYEEAWLTLQISVNDLMSSKMHEALISLLKECKDNDYYLIHDKVSAIKRLFYNYIYFAGDSSEKETVDQRIEEILGLANTPGCERIILEALPVLAEASPKMVLKFIKNEVDKGIVYKIFYEPDDYSRDYLNILWALDKVSANEDAAIQACNVLCQLSQVNKKYYRANSPKESLLNALCLWDNHAAISLENKKLFAITLINRDAGFGVPFCVELLNKTMVSRGVRVGEKERSKDRASIEELNLAYKEISQEIIKVSIKEKRGDWLLSVIEIYRHIPCEVLLSSANDLRAAGLSPESKLPIIFQIKSSLFYLQKNLTDEKMWIEALDKWLEVLTTDDAVTAEGWRFYKYYQYPFPELIHDSEYWNEKRAQSIREGVLDKVRKKYGSEGVLEIISCMDNEYPWGIFLGKNLVKNEYTNASILLRHKNRIVFAGFIDAIDYNNATEIYCSLTPDEQKQLLPLLSRDDIDDWLRTPEHEKLYWQFKRITEYNERAYQKLIKYNPSGILFMFAHSEKSIEFFNKLIETLNAIIHSEDCSDNGMLTYVVKEYDAVYYSDEWAELCLSLYQKSLLDTAFLYYPDGVRKYFFIHPEKIAEFFDNDIYLFEHNYKLPGEAYEDWDAFEVWADYLLENSKEKPFLRTVLGYTLGKCGNGSDGSFPHEFVRKILEKYNDDKLTRNVATGWLNEHSFRAVEDGHNEMEMEKRYREDARKFEVLFPQTASLLKIIADDFRWNSERDQRSAEIFPL